MPSSFFEHTVAIEVPVERVWAALMLPETWASIGPVEEVREPTFEGETLTGYLWSTTVGGKQFKGTAKAVAHERPTRYAMDLDGGEMAGRISIDLSQRNPDTEIRARLDFQTKGLLSSMFFPLIRDAIAKGFPGQIEGFAASLG